MPCDGPYHEFAPDAEGDDLCLCGEEPWDDEPDTTPGAEAPESR